MIEVHYRTDHKWKPFVYGYDVPDKVLKEFDYLYDDSSHDGFFRYLGHWYHTSDFMIAPKELPWDGYSSDSFFSGVVVRISKDGESYQVGTYIS